MRNRSGNILLVLSVVLALVAASAAGYFYWKYPQGEIWAMLKEKVIKPTAPKQSPHQVEQTQVDQPDETANWKTFNNYGISFKYPSEWKEKSILIQGSGFTQEIEDAEGFYKFIFISHGNYNQVTGKPYSTLDEIINMPYKTKPVTVGGQEGRQLLPRAGSENIYEVFFFSKDSKFIMSLELNTPKDSSRIGKGKRIFGQILSTFKFL